MSLPTVTMSGKQPVAREAPHVHAKPPEAGLHLVGDEDCRRACASPPRPARNPAGAVKAPLLERVKHFDSQTVQS
jgi:hypothetical protein